MIDLVDAWVAGAPRDVRSLDEGQLALLSAALDAQRSYASLKAAAQDRDQPADGPPLPRSSRDDHRQPGVSNPAAG